MKVTRVVYDNEPDRILSEDFDCLWICFRVRKAQGPIKSRVLQSVDWKLQGVLSRFLLGARKEKKTTFIPTMAKMPIPFLALDSHSSPDWNSFVKNCEGQKWTEVLFFCEDSASLDRFETELKKVTANGFPESIILASDQSP